MIAIPPAAMMKARWATRLCLLAAAAMAAGACTPLAKVRPQQPKWRPVAVAAARSDEQKLAAAERLVDARPTDALAAYLDAAESALAVLQRDPTDATALRNYDYSVSRTISIFRNANMVPWTHPVKIAGHTIYRNTDKRTPPITVADRTVEWHSNVRAQLRPEDFDFHPVDELKLGGKMFREPVRRAGLGAPLVAVRREPLKDFRKYYLGSEHVYWFFSYPSGYPFPYSATLLRRELDGIATAYPQRQPLVLAGHSMGGLLTRLMVTESGDHIWRDILGTAPAETRLPPATRQLLEDSLLFHPRPEVARAVFFSTPHRGSDLSDGWAARQVSRFVKLPGTLVQAGQGLLTSGLPNQGTRHLRRLPTSLDTLSPKAPFVIAMNRRPLIPKLPHHQIIGDRGKGNSPDSSDGVVPFWSSHLDTAQSTKIVPSGHGSHAHPEGIAEMRRLLQLHLNN